MSNEMRRLTYLTVKTCQDGGAFWAAQDAVARTVLEHPEWSLTETKTWDEWEAEE